MTYLNRLLARQKIDVRDVDYEQMKKIRREKNVVNASEILRRNDIAFSETNSTQPELGVCWVIPFPSVPDRPILYHPETGEWGHSGGIRHFGCRNLVKYLKGECL
jgi:hypothetical protein